MVSGEARLILSLSTCLGIRNTWGSQNIFKGNHKVKATFSLIFCCLWESHCDFRLVSNSLVSSYPLASVSRMLELQGYTAKSGSKGFQHSTNMQCAFLMLHTSVQVQCLGI